MRSFITIPVFSIFCIQISKAQDSTILLKASRPGKFTDQINLSNLLATIYKEYHLKNGKKENLQH